MNTENTYLSWRQDDPRFNQAEAWPRKLFPDAQFRYFHESGCLVCALAIMLRHSGIEKETNEILFNPWILNQRLIAVGAFDSQADLELDDISKLYPTVSYLGDYPYSRENIEKFTSQRYACLISVPGKRSTEHFTALCRLLEDDVTVIDPIIGERRLSEYKKIISIRVFRKCICDSFHV